MLFRFRANDIAGVTPLPVVDVENMSVEDRRTYTLSVEDRQKSLATAFRDRMTTGQSFNDSNKYRQNFYDDVIKLAEEENFQTFTVF